MRAIVVESLGDPEVLRVREVPPPMPGAGQTLIGVARAGVNFADVERRRTGWSNPPRPLPIIPGFEVVGRRLTDGARVLGVIPEGTGGYAEYAVAADELTLPVPSGVSDTAALAAAIQGSTAWGLLLAAARLAEGETVAVTAAAGGLGSLALQLARLHGAGRVIAVASTDAKRRLALELGADATVDVDPHDLARAIRAANRGAGVDVFLESAGGPLTDAALDALGYNGRLVVFGQASGASNTVSLDRLMDRSIGVIGFWATPFLREGSAARDAISTMLEWIGEGRLRIVEGTVFPVAQAAAAHAAIEARTTVGKVTLVVDDAAWTVAPAAMSGQHRPADDVRSPRSGRGPLGAGGHRGRDAMARRTGRPERLCR